MLSLVKDTALISVIGLNETLFVAKQAITVTGKPFTMYIVVGAIYLGFSSVITLTVMGLEKFGERTTVISK
jgi:polar amino acid transport system permease protein